MTNNESAYIRNKIITIKPKVVLEVGTNVGQGSSTDILESLKKYGGVLHTWESYEPFYKIACDYFSTRYVNVIPHLGDFNKDMELLDAKFLSTIDLLFLDGGDEDEFGQPTINKDDWANSESVSIFKKLISRINIGTNILLHDWVIEHGRGRFVKNYIDNVCGWDRFKFIDMCYTGFPDLGLAHIVLIK